jgi:hypothetical protein
MIITMGDAGSDLRARPQGFPRLCNKQNKPEARQNSRLVAAVCGVATTQQKTILVGEAVRGGESQAVVRVAMQPTHDF